MPLSSLFRLQLPVFDRLCLIAAPSLLCAAHGGLASGAMLPALANALLCLAVLAGLLLMAPRVLAFVAVLLLNTLALAWLGCLGLTGDAPVLGSVLAALQTDSAEALSLLRAAPWLTASIFGAWLVQLLATVALLRSSCWSELRVRQAGSRVRLLALIPLALPLALPEPMAQAFPTAAIALASQARSFTSAASQLDPAPVAGVTQQTYLQTLAPRVVLIIGESSSASFWGEGIGADKGATPHMAGRLARGELVAWTRHMSTAPSTALAVPAMLSPYGQVAPAQGRPWRHSVVTVFKKAGFHTRWHSLQAPQPASTEADESSFATDQAVFDGKSHDEELLPHLRPLAQATGPQLLVLHTAGSHFPFENRYPPEFEVHKRAAGARYPASQTLGNYRNSVAYTDHVLEKALQFLSSDSFKNQPVLVIYAADHGESLMKGVSRDRAALDEQVLHVPVLWWGNPTWRKANEPGWLALKAAGSVPTSHLNLSPTLTSLLGIGYTGKPVQLDVLSPAWKPWEKTPALAPDYRTVVDVEPPPPRSSTVVEAPKNSKVEPP